MCLPQLFLELGDINLVSLIFLSLIVLHLLYAFPELIILVGQLKILVSSIPSRFPLLVLLEDEKGSVVESVDVAREDLSVVEAL